MKILFLDDERFYSDVYWIKYPKTMTELLTLRDYFEFRVAIKNLISLKDVLFSFDHDLQCFESGKEYTGMDCVKALVECILDDTTGNLKASDLNFIVHSQNPVGKLNIESYLNNFIKSQS